jgi:hypothetical protein
MCIDMERWACGGSTHIVAHNVYTLSFGWTRAMAVVRRILTASFWVPATYYLLSSDVTGFFYLTAVVAISLQEYFFVIAPGLNINLGSEECKGENKVILGSANSMVCIFSSKAPSAMMLQCTCM